MSAFHVSQPDHEFDDRPERPGRYDGFISYGQRRDLRFARLVRDAVQRVGKRLLQRRAVHVFLDTSGLTAGVLWTDIERRMEESRYLILLASPAAAQSPWVDRELRWWLREDRLNHVLIAVTEGSWEWDFDAGDFTSDSTAVPESLRGAYVGGDPPRVVDLREFDAGQLRSSVWLRRLSGRYRYPDAFLEKISELAAPLHGKDKDKDDLFADDLRLRRRYRRIASGLALLILMSLGGLGLYARGQDQRAEREALAARSGALAERAEAEINRDPQLASLLSLESIRVGSTPAAWASLGAVLSETNHRAITLDVGEEDGATSVALSPDGQLVAAGTYEGRVVIWDTATGEKLNEERHDDSVFGVAFSPDSSTLATSSDDKTIGLWQDLAGNMTATFLREHVQGVWPVTFDPSGTVLASAAGSEVRLWNATTGRPIGRLPAGDDEDVQALAFSPDGSLLATGGLLGTLRIWDVARQAEVGGPVVASSDSVWSVAFSPDGARLATAGVDGVVRVWEGQPHNATSTVREVTPAIQADNSAAWSVAFSPDGSRLATTGRDRVVKFWDPESGEPAGAPLLGHQRDVNQITFSRDGQSLATASDDGTVRIWNLVPVLPLGAELRSSGSHVSGMAYSPDGRTIVTAGADGSVRMWDVAMGRLKRELAAEDPVGIASDRGILDVEYTADGEMFLTAGEDSYVRPFDGDNGEPHGKPMQCDAAVIDLAVHPTEQLVAATTRSGSVYLWNIQVGGVTELQPRHQGAAGHATFSHDGSILASSGADGSVFLWDTDSARQLGEPVERHSDLVLTLAFSPDDQLLASAGADDRVIVWSTTTAEPTAQASARQGLVTDLAFTPDNKFLASTGERGVVRFWDPSSLMEDGQIATNHSGRINALGFSADGRFMTTVGDDSTVRLWDPGQGEQIGGALRQHQGPIQDVILSPDGRGFATAGEDGTARLWLLPDRWIPTACSFTGRNLSLWEWNDNIGREHPYVRQCVEYPPGEGVVAENVPGARYGNPIGSRRR